METIGTYKDIPLTIDPASATVFAVIGWVVVLAILLYALYRWYTLRRKPTKLVEVAEKA